MSNELKNNELLNEAVENITEAELKEIAAAGDVKPEATPLVIATVTAAVAVSATFGCKKK